MRFEFKAEVGGIIEARSREEALKTIIKINPTYCVRYLEKEKWLIAQCVRLAWRLLKTVQTVVEIVAGFGK